MFARSLILVIFLIAIASPYAFSEESLREFAHLASRQPGWIGQAPAASSLSSGSRSFPLLLAGHQTEAAGRPGMTASSSAGSGIANSGALSNAVSGNPAAVNIFAGNGALGDFLGINRNGIRFSGLNITDANLLASGGLAPGTWLADSLTIADLSINTEERFGWTGGLLGTEFLYFAGGPVNEITGGVMGYNSLDAGPPRYRAEFYELWYRQELCDEKLVVRVGKSVPTYDFNNVLRTVPMTDASANIASVSSAILTPLYVSPTMQGIMPGYYNSATGIVVTCLPTPSFYAQYGFFDGNLANGVQTGLTGPHFNGYYLHLAEVGARWTLGAQHKPGTAGVGGWGQTGILRGLNGQSESGAQGVYLFGSQRLSYRRPGESNQGLSAYLQFAASNSGVVPMQRYFGCGLSYNGPLPGRDADSAGFSLAYGEINPAINGGATFLSLPDGNLLLLTRPRNTETLLTWYYQMQVTKNTFFQPNLSYLPEPGLDVSIAGAFAITLRAIVLF